MTSDKGLPHYSWLLGDGLTPLEEEMLAATAAGEQLDRAEGPFDLVAMKDWDSHRTVRAEVLRYLLVEDDWPVHAKGVRLGGVQISGHLDLEAATLRCPLRLEHCYLSSRLPVNFDYASASLLTLTLCHLAGLRGDALTITKDLDLSGSTFTSQVLLLGAKITGQLNCSSVQLTADSGDDGIALWADGMEVGGSMLLDDTMTEAGAVWLRGADIGGQFSCRGAELKGVDKNRNALSADDLKVGANVFLGRDGDAPRSEVLLAGGHDMFLGQTYTAADGVKLTGKDIAGPLPTRGARVVTGGQTFTAAGAIVLSGAHITGQLSCRGAQLKGATKDGEALSAHGITVGSDVALDEDFTAAGAVRLTSADIAGTLLCSRSRLGVDKKGNALRADGMKVGGDVVLNDEFTAAGTVSLQSARVDGSLSLMSTKLHGDKALDATGAQITHELRWGPSEPVLGLVTLEDAVVGELQDFWLGPAGIERHNGFWPPADQGQLLLDGFIYARIGGEQSAKLEHRLAWLGSQPKRVATRTAKSFATRPYEQLVKVYQQAGQDTEARKVAIARRRDLRWYGELTRSRKVGNWLLDVTIRYGYETWRAVLGLIAVFAVVLAVFWLAQYRTGLVVPTHNTAGLQPALAAVRCTSYYPCFSPVGYALDTVIPLINVHQADYWRPNANAAWGWAVLYVTWAGTGFGWALSTLAVAGYTGLARKVDAP